MDPLLRLSFFSVRIEGFLSQNNLEMLPFFMILQTNMQTRNKPFLENVFQLLMASITVQILLK